MANDVRLSDDRMTRIMLRPIGSPLPLGFFAFCVGTLLFSTQELGWLQRDQGHILALIMLAFVAPLELLPSVLAYFARDTIGATILGLFSLNWVIFALFMLLWPPGTTSPALALFLSLSAAIFLGMAIIAIPTKPFFSVLLFTTTARTAFLAMYHFGGGSSVSHVAGLIGLVLASIALYGGLALLIEDARHETVLPLFRRGAAKQAIEGSLADQIARTRNEAGVRQQL